MEAIILAGGMGTRLRPVVEEIPKVMAPVAGKPFLYYILKRLEAAGFTHVILALGYRHEVIEKWVASFPTPMTLSLVVEEKPLGTGGAVRQALRQATETDVFILNGDTFFPVDYAAMLSFHQAMGGKATLALKEMRPATRYGLVEHDTNGFITRFGEKQICAHGLINGGVYLMRREALADYPERFSLEKDYFEKVVGAHALAAFISDRYFLDIGIPEDYEQAQKDFADGCPETF